MRLVLISDTHNLHPHLDLPGGDVLIHAGDISVNGGALEIGEFGQWFSAQRHKHKIVIAGNHDFLFEDRAGQRRGPYSADCVYLQDDAVEIDGLRFYGSPYTPRFFDGPSTRTAARSPRALVDIPAGTDVLITHGPPFGILDLTYEGEHPGCWICLTRCVGFGPSCTSLGTSTRAMASRPIPRLARALSTPALMAFNTLNPPIVVDI